MNTAAPKVPIPAHVPAELVRDFPLVMGVYTDENPWERIVPEACDCPDVFTGPTCCPPARAARGFSGGRRT